MLPELKHSLSPPPNSFGGKWREVKLTGSHLSQQPMAVSPSCSQPSPQCWSPPECPGCDLSTYDCFCMFTNSEVNEEQAVIFLTFYYCIVHTSTSMYCLNVSDSTKELIKWKGMTLRRKMNYACFN